MISKVDFQNIKTSYSVDYSYTDIYDWDGGTLETASDVGILSQESRSVSFNLKYNAFLQSLIDDDDLYLDYKVVVYNDDSTVEFKGFLKEDGSISIDSDTLMVKIEISDIFYFVKEGGDFPSNLTEEININETIILGLLSGIKNRQPYNDYSGDYGGGSDGYMCYAPTDKYFLDKGLSVISKEILVPKIVQTLASYEKDALTFRVKVRDVNGKEDTYQNTDPSNLVLFTTDETIPATNENFYKKEDTAGWILFRYIWVDTDNPLDVDDYYVKYEKHIFDFYLRSPIAPDANYDYITPILGETIKFNQTYGIVEKGLVKAAELSHKYFNDYKSIRQSVTDALLAVDYYITVVEDNPGCSRKINSMGSIFVLGDDEANLTDGDEFIAIQEAKTKDYQHAFYIDYSTGTDINGDYVIIYLMYLTKSWGTVWHKDIDGRTPTNKGNNYSYRKRTLKFRGFSLIYDDWNTNYVQLQNQPYKYEAYTTYNNASPYNDAHGNYSLSRHWSNDNTAYLSIPIMSEFFDFDDFGVTLKNAKYGEVANFDCPDLELNTLGIYGSFNFAVTLNSSEYIYTINNGSVVTYSGGSDSSNFRNQINSQIFVYGGINIKSYIYKNPFNSYDAIRLCVISNLFAMISYNTIDEIHVVNKVPITTSISFSSADIIKLKQDKVLPETFDETIYDVLDFENKENLNTIIIAFIKKTLSVLNKEVSFEYSSIFSAITPIIGNNFDYDGLKYSIVSVTKKNDYIYALRAIRNGETTLFFSNNGVDLIQAQLSNDGINMLTWNVRSI